MKAPSVQPETAAPLYDPPAAEVDEPVVRPGAQPAAPVEQAGVSYAPGPARERAYEAASEHAARHGGLPTVSDLMALAGVSRGTAGAALKDLRDQRPSLHVVNTDQTRTSP